MRTLLIILFWCAAGVVLHTGCSTNKNMNCTAGIDVTLVDASGLDGCTWLFETDRGDRLEPINLEDFIENPENGDRYRIEYDIADDVASICMAGQIIRIKCIDKLP